MLQQLFKQRYLESLRFYKHFYDDIHEYGNRDNPSKVFYFIPGISGVPGQVRFIFPSLCRVFGADIYVRCCHHPAFSAARPIWEKYTAENLDKKRDVIVADLSKLLSRHGEVVVIASSNGFYDFAYAWRAMNDASAAARVKLLWGACAPDRFEKTPWEGVFFRLNGFVHGSHRWFAYPNHNLLRFLNPETATSYSWRHETQRKTFYKVDLESRFVCLNLYWDYISIGCFNATIEHLTRGADGPLDLEAHVLVAANDGFWQRRGEAEVTAVVGRYLAPKKVIFKDTSHLWVVVPEHATELLRQIEGTPAGASVGGIDGAE